MNIDNSNDVIKFNIEHTLDGLRENYGHWRKHIEKGDSILYALLGACLEFHTFLVREADYQSVFKGLCSFSWHKNTGLTTLIAKMVFGAKNKQTYTYIKALDAALANTLQIATVPNAGCTAEASDIGCQLQAISE